MRFTTEHDTPCLMRLGRMGYLLTGEFRAPKRGELFVQPTDSEELQEHEPVILGACGEFATEACRHIVVEIPEKVRGVLEDYGPLGLLLLALEEVIED